MNIELVPAARPHQKRHGVVLHTGTVASLNRLFVRYQLLTNVCKAIWTSGVKGFFRVRNLSPPFCVVYNTPLWRSGRKIPSTGLK
jgi:hypothetical protein